MTKRTVTLIEGDGIGPEIAAATVRAVEAAGGQIEWERADAGAGAVDKHKDPLPQATIESIKKNQLALKGPLATPSGGGYRSVNVTLRQQFDLDQYVARRNSSPDFTFREHLKSFGGAIEI